MNHSLSDPLHGVASVLTIALAASVLGCESGSVFQDSTGPQITDSAGVSVVQNTAPAWASGEAWRIEPEPALQIGVVDGEDPYIFEQIRSPGRLSDGRLFLFESASREIRVYDPQGRYINAIGRSGEGPGEFQSDPIVVATPGDTLLTWTALGTRLARFLPDGQLVRESVQTAAGLRRNLDDLVAVNWDLLPDGTVFFNADDVRDQASSRPRFQEGERVVTRRHVGLFLDEVSRAGANFRVPFAEFYGLAVNPAFPRPVVVPEAFPVRLHISTPGSWEIRTYDADGALIRITRLPLPRQPMNREWISAQLETVPPRARSEVEAALGAFTIPDSISPIAGFHADLEGNLWIADAATRRGESIDEIQVVDSAGRWLGQVDATVVWNGIQEIGSDYVLVVWRDDYRIPYLRLHRLVKP